MNNDYPLTWYGHSSWRLNTAGAIIYFDPWKLPAGQPPANLILITHEHHDHCSPVDIKNISTDQTVIVASASCQAELSGRNCHLVHPGQWLPIGNIKITTVPAYNIDKPFHPNDNSRVGYIVTVQNTRYYHAGDTDLLPTMDGLQADVVMLPIGGTYTMTAAEAAQAAKLIKPRLAIPMHYGDIIGSTHDAELFKSLLAPDIPVKIFTP